MSDRDELVALRRMAKLEAKEKASVDPTNGMSTPERLAAGAVSGVAKFARAAGQAFGLVDQKEIDEANQIDAPLQNTAAGKVGSFVGQAAPVVAASFIPMLNTYAGATALGAAAGALGTEGDLKDRAVGAVTGGLGGAAGKALGDFLGVGASLVKNKLAQAASAKQVANAGRDAAATAAKNAGYVLPPNEVNPSVLNQLTTGFSGKIKTGQAASEANQGVTNALAKAAVGARQDAPLTIDALNSIRKQAGQAYDAVASTGTVTPGPAYQAALDKITAPYTRAAQSFPGGKPPPVLAEIESLRTGQFDAGDAVAKIRQLRDQADTAYRAGDKASGRALKDGAAALEDALDDHLTKIGQPGLLGAYRDARKLIAKTYSVQSGLNDTTGDVAASALARQLAKGKPLTNELETIARTAQAFPKSTQLLTQAPGDVSPLDFAVSATTGAATGNPLAALMLAARPAVRSVVLSRPYQSLVQPPTYGTNALTRLVLDGARQPVLTNALVAGGVTGARDSSARK